MSFKYHNQGIEGDRNFKMIQILAEKNSEGEFAAKGVFLFALYGKVGEQAPVFITPAGISDTEAENMCKEFFELFGKYAKAAEERKK
jgi:hypothetical protein